MTTKKAQRRTPQVDTLDKHPEELRHDLDPNALAGQNIGEDTAHPERTAVSLYDFKAAHTRFPELSADELQRIRIVPPGSRLLSDATYLDLDDPDRRELTATPDMEVGDGSSWSRNRASITSSGTACAASAIRCAQVPPAEVPRRLSDGAGRAACSRR